jgi:chromosome segregation ATPase
MSIQQSEMPVRPGRNNRDRASTTTVDESGRSIVALLERAADSAKDDCARAMDLAHRLTFQVRAAEEQARDAEARAQHAEEQARRAEARAKDAEARARRVEARAQDAEDRVRRAEARAQDAEGRVQALETEVADFRDRALRAEDWLRLIHTEAEQAFFGKKENGLSQLPREKPKETKHGAEKLVG